MTTRESIRELQERVSSSIIGQERIVETILIGLLANGHLLIEGLPGLAKTRSVKSMAQALDVGLSRVQFTPDLLPSDITGAEVYFADSSDDHFHFKPGPIFSNFVLADEINRAPAKVQSALLEAMEERQVTVGGTTHTLPDLFMVLATQNPIEHEGTYPLPEAQMDRFLMHVTISYPSEEAEAAIVRLVREEEGHTQKVGAPIDHQVIFDARKEIQSIHTSETVEKYIVDLVVATRDLGRYDESVAHWVDVGASPRGAIALDRCSRAHAWLHGSDFVTPEDVRAVLHDCLRHRILLGYEANAEGVSTRDVIDRLVQWVAAP